MARRIGRYTVLSLGVVLGLPGCMANMQTSSGADYLVRYPVMGGVANAAAPTSDLNAAVRQAADIEPTAHFPMKICLARINQFGGGLTDPPADELPVWGALEQKLGSGYGEFAVLNPLIASFAAANYVGPANESTGSRLAAEVRLGAARQHCDTAFLYSPEAHANSSDTPLQLLNLTVVGYFLVPSTGVKAEGSATGLLVDVRTGYPYAQLTGTSKTEIFTTGNSQGDALRNRQEMARVSAVADMVDKVPAALAVLREKLGKAKAGGTVPVSPSPPS
jgi:hypothetical protein